jgi:hypothetical protein
MVIPRPILSTLDDDIPLGSFNYFEGADIAHPDLVLIAESRPT